MHKHRINTQIYIHTTHTYTHTHTRTYTHIHIRTHTNTHTHTHTQIYTYTHANTHTKINVNFYLMCTRIDSLLVQLANYITETGPNKNLSSNKVVIYSYVAIEIIILGFLQAHLIMKSYYRYSS